MIPDGWRLGTLSALTDTVMGYAFKSSDFVSSGIPLLRMGNLYQNQLDIDRSPVCLPMSYRNKYARFLIKKGDLVMSMTGTMGKRDYGFTVQIPEDALDALLNQRVLKFVPKKDSSPGYLLNLLRSELILSRLFSFPGGTKQANLSAKQVQELPALIPPLPEQKKIAKILSTWDRTIEVTEKLLSNSQQQKKSLMQQLLTGKKRLPGFSGEWRKVPVNKFSILGKEKFDSKKDSIGRYCIELEHIEQGTARLLNSITTNNNMSTKSVFQKGDVLFGKLRPYLRKYLLASRGGVCSPEIWVLKPKKENIASELLFQLVQTEHFIDAANISSGTHMPRADWNVVRDVLFKIPLIEEQQKIASVLSTADQEIETLQQKLTYLKQEKKALMQQLLTGKRRVKINGVDISQKEVASA